MCFEDLATLATGGLFNPSRDARKEREAKEREAQAKALDAEKAPTGGLPPTAASRSVLDAESEAKKRISKRKGQRATILAGETGGFKPQLTGGRQTLLGGGG